jgi:uncharacterized protein with HEPN domain
MKPSDTFDFICVEKILKHIQTINDAYVLFNITNANDLAENHLCQLAVTQAITNIHELRQRIQESTINKMLMFASLRLGLKAARNIASHDYDSLDFGIIFKMVNKLTDTQVIRELEAVIHAIQSNHPSD